MAMASFAKKLHRGNIVGMTMRTTLKVQKQRTIVSNVEHKLLLINWTFQLKQKIDWPSEIRIVKKIRQIEGKCKQILFGLTFGAGSNHP